MKKVSIIGSGFSGLAAACSLAKEGFDVDVFEKNDIPGGRARQFKDAGFTFDMGPSWYWMPEVFEDFFNKFGKTTKDYYNLVRLDPSYTVFFGKGDRMDIPADFEALCALFDSIESGSSKKLKAFLKEAQYKYEVGMSEYVWKPGHSIMEFMDMKVFRSFFRLHMFSSISSQIRKQFTHPKLIQLLEFPVLFLGAAPMKTPALYSLMNYADIKLGTWYPEGGMYEIIKALVSLAEELNVRIHCNEAVREIQIKEGKAQSILTTKDSYKTNYVIGSADYHHIDQNLLTEQYRSYSPQYWDSRVMAPSSLLYYVGINKKLDYLSHHNLFFDADFEKHSKEIYDDISWPDDPLFYVCCPSKTDKTVAPENHENLFFLIPIAPGLEDDEKVREKYFDVILRRMSKIFNEDLTPHVVYNRSFCINDFKADYNAFKGNAYGLANTLRQTAFLKPKMKSSKVKNLFFTGHLTTPGPGVPPSIISGQVVSREIINGLNKMK